MIDDQAQLQQYVELAQGFFVKGNKFAHGYWLGRALEYADQNAVDPEWLREKLDEYGLDSTLVGIPKLDNVHRG